MAGALQREVIAATRSASPERPWVSIDMIAERIWPLGSATRYQRESLARAIRTLARKGIVEAEVDRLMYDAETQRDAKPSWFNDYGAIERKVTISIPRRGLWVRLPDEAR